MSDRGALSKAQTERWFAAIADRRDRRSFDGAPIAAGLLDELGELCDSFRPYDDARLAVIRADAGELGPLFPGIIGGWGAITGATAALAVAVAGPHQGVHEHAGYAGEAAILEATALGLGTCWVAGFFDPARAAEMVPHADDETILAVSPLGNPCPQLSRTERVIHRIGKPERRRRLEHIGLGLMQKDWPGWAVAGLRAVQTAPSAMNRQPWRFRMDGDHVVLAYEGDDRGRVSRRLDCGIAMLHFELGVRHFGRAGSWRAPGTDRPADVARWVPAAGLLV